MTPPIKIIAFDLETTGRMSEGSSRWQDQCGITQIGAACVEYLPTHPMSEENRLGVSMRWEITDRFNTYIDPEMPEDRWHAEAIEKTGISPDTVKDAPNLLMAHADLANFFVGATHSITYNGEWFDYPVLQYQLQRYGLDKNFPWPPCHIDLMKYGADWYEKAGKRGIKRPTLGELYEVVTGQELQDAHDAMADITATVEIFIKKGGLEGLGYL